MDKKEFNKVCQDALNRSFSSKDVLHVNYNRDGEFFLITEGHYQDDTENGWMGFPLKSYLNGEEIDE